jgi:hypothetical protein
MARNYQWLLIGPEPPRELEAEPSSDAVRPEEILLFARGKESIRITISPATMTLQLLGPGRLQKSLEFDTAAALAEFLECYEQQALGTGWELLNVPERRTVSRR